MEIQGRVKMIGATQTVGANGFQKRELVVTTEEQYPQHILIEFIQDKCALLDVLKVGQQVKVSINLRGREWINPQGEVRYFNSISGWKIEQIQVQPVVASQGSSYVHTQPAMTGQSPVAQSPFPPAQDFSVGGQEEEEDDLPF